MSDSDEEDSDESDYQIHSYIP